MSDPFDSLRYAAPPRRAVARAPAWRRLLVAALLPAVLATGCAFIAERSATPKTAATQRSAAAAQADALFWKTLHAGDYAGIDKAVRALQIAYLATPTDAVTAAHIGFLRAWQATESARLPAPDPATTDQIALARRYFGEAHALVPDEARFHGFWAGMTLAEASIHGDERLTRRGYYALRDAIDAWPEFNLFTGGYVMSRQPADHPRFAEALDWQWRTLDLCAGQPIDRTNPDFGRFMHLATTTGPKRVCWNSWIAPHNFEGFFLNMGDMLVKSGRWEVATKIYATAQASPTYRDWPYRDVLERRIADARQNVAAFNATEPHPDKVDKRIMIQTPFACVGCHQVR